MLRLDSAPCRSNLLAVALLLAKHRGSHRYGVSYEKPLSNQAACRPADPEGVNYRDRAALPNLQLAAITFHSVLN